MDQNKKIEKLDVSEEAQQIRLERRLLVVDGLAPPAGPPAIVPLGRSKVLDRAKLFLPTLAAAQADLAQRIESGENVDIEACASDAQYIEMNVGILSKDKKGDLNKSGEEEWSADSEPDSPPSPADRDNEYTSDTDPDSTSGSESSTSHSSRSPERAAKGSPLSHGKLRIPGQNGHSPNQKRPLIQELSSGNEDSNSPKQPSPKKEK